MTFRNVTAAAAVLALLAVGGCATGAQTQSQTKKKAEVEKVKPVELSSNVVGKNSDVEVDTVVTASAKDGKLTDATLYTGDDPSKNVVKGEMSGGEWIAQQLLEPGKTYHLSMVGENAKGKSKEVASEFTTQNLSLKQQTYPSVAPLNGETVGVGMPIIVKFDLPVKNKALFERKMHVNSTPSVEGSWSWLSDNVVHYRPKSYWPAGTKVEVKIDVNSLPAGNGVYGQKNQDIKFNIGKSVVSTINVGNHKMSVAINGKVVRSMPVTTGKSGFVTRAGTKVVMSKFSSVRMDASSIGIDKDSPDYYDLDNVKWALRVTSSGEFVHAAPWSTGSQGLANVSHGCTGLSTTDAHWLFKQTQRGDIMKFVNSPRGLESGNGWTDWDKSYADFAKGSAL